MSGQSAPPPTRGPSVASGDDDGEAGEEEGGGASAAVSLADLMPKVEKHVICMTFFSQSDRQLLLSGHP